MVVRAVLTRARLIELTIKTASAFVSKQGKLVGWTLREDYAVVPALARGGFGCFPVRKGFQIDWRIFDVLN